MTIKFGRRNIDDFVEYLEHHAPRDASAASAAALNRTANAAKLFAKQNLKREFTLRNKWTLGSVFATKTPASRPMARQFTKAGSARDYLALQERGGALKESKLGRRITTPEGSQEGRVARPRQRLARGQYANRNIRLQKNQRIKGPRKKQIAGTIRNARVRGDRFVYFETAKRRRGIFRVTDTRVTMVHRIMERRVRIKQTKWLAPAATKARRVAPKVFAAELQRRFKPN